MLGIISCEFYLLLKGKGKKKIPVSRSIQFHDYRRIVLVQTHVWQKSRCICIREIRDKLKLQCNSGSLLLSVLFLSKRKLKFLKELNLSKLDNGIHRELKSLSSSSSPLMTAHLTGNSFHHHSAFQWLLM